ncbi:MAG: hypothetical protein HY290_24760 [Planctomycetia bacterium]|nr:hypothetical protein [Planctomycetia bacterium]
MFSRIRAQIARPWILRPRHAAAFVAVLAALSASSAFAQRGGGGGGGGGCSGGMGGGGGTSAGGAGGAGLASVGGTGGTGGISAFAARQMNAQNQQAFFNIPSANMYQFDYPPVYNHQQYMAERRAFRAAQADQRQQRLAMKKSPKTRPERPSSDRG